MKACKCDICGAYVDKEDIPIIIGHYCPGSTRLYGKESPEDFKFEICYECYNILYKFLKTNQGKETKNE